MNRNTFIDYIERLRTKPEHIRRRIAVGTAVGSTVVVAAAWLFVLVSSGSLVINPNVPAGTATVAQNNLTQLQQANAQTKTGFQDLLGAVGFASATTTAPALTIVYTDASSSSPSQNQSTGYSPSGGNQTVIPF